LVTFYFIVGCPLISDKNDKGDIFSMNDEIESICEEETDYIHHILNEQITRICVKEEEERMREELKK
jgi:hypothetical protein